MRHYETVFIINPELSEEDTQATVEKFTGILDAGGATLVKLDLWGRRRLAYEVKKFSKGFFVLMDYGADPSAVDEMERNFKIDERVIRFLTVKKNDVFDLDAIARAEEEAKAKAAQRAAQAAAEAEAAEHGGDDEDEGDNEFVKDDDSE